MGLRYRKSINLGGGFRVNFSKSGIGYSWGFKGYRVTKKAGGGVRKTYSVPGTGISYVEDSKNKSKKSNNNKFELPKDNDINDIVYKSEDIDSTQLVTENSKEFISAIKKYSLYRKLLKYSSTILFFSSFAFPPIAFVFLLCIISYFIFNYKAKINIEYECDEYGNMIIDLFNEAMSYLINMKKIYKIDSIKRNDSKRINAGANNNFDGKVIKIKKKKPFFLRTNATCYVVTMKKGSIFILPDRLIIKDKKGWGIIENSELEVKLSNQIVIEDIAPKDAAVLGYTWLYVNNNGTPDKRYKNNRQLPRCNYGKVELKTNTGFEMILYLSSDKDTYNFIDKISKIKI